MSRRLTLVVVVVVAIATLSTADISDDFDYLCKIFAGQYDNSWQVFEDLVRDFPANARHMRFSAEIFSENIPIFPSNIKTFYLQEYIGGDPRNIVRQKIYAFQINSTTQQIVLKFYGFVDPTKFINAQENPDIFQNLTWSQLVYVPGCDIKWDRIEPDLFRSSALSECIIVYNTTSFKIEDSNDLTSHYLTVNEKWTFVSNGSVYREGTPYNLSKQTTPAFQHQQPSKHNRIGGKRSQLNNFNQIIQALSSALPVTFYIDLPRCKLGEHMYPQKSSFILEDDFSIDAYSIDIDTFEFFNSSVFGPIPYFGFSDAPIVRTSQGDLLQLREGLVSNANMLTLTITWLYPANYSRAQQFIMGCNIRDSMQGDSGQVLAVYNPVSLTQINSFQELVTAIKAGYNFRFFVRYLDCTQGPEVNAFAGGIIEGMKLGSNGTYATFSKSKLITNYQGSGYVTDIVTGTFDSSFVASFVASDDYVQTFKRVYIETFICPISTENTRKAVDLYMY